MITRMSLLNQFPAHARSTMNLAASGMPSTNSRGDFPAGRPPRSIAAGSRYSSTALGYLSFSVARRMAVSLSHCLSLRS